MKIIFILYFFISASYICRRGKLKHKFTRQLTDHSTFMAFINFPLYIFSKIKTTPYLETHSVDNLNKLKDNWEIIRQEALALEQDGLISTSDKLDDAAFNSFFRKGWSRFYISWYGAEIPSAMIRSPQTTLLVQSIPNIKAAMFARLKAGSRLGLHRDPYAGSLRYHLGLITPNDDKCYINVDGEPYHWRDGEDVLFDETYLHEAINNTNCDRIILLCDIERPLKFRVIRLYNKFISYVLLKSAAAPNEIGDKTGGINKAFKYIYQIRIVGKKLRKFNKPLYYFIKYCIFLGLITLLFF
ncbi:aspartyl/asparaginyl beta-hydroxylase domain-containing protein [Shewanella surugensis]|uniref:Aspartyl/asparaginyl beta-hydroxylase domain-containing protein n=1 Tax=Shewanella surugensis TaxID=212020 RepID=A0ABT0LB46_9GAMM|nr:aspartyl/asparaginyl beta-hydroxylase domain-containing protein [Shewanella surugensis]MCL1124794.1 aspartyl/asparaginyl beta-hydroxylase domain-containing protein [Shewanella surugensis]